MGAIYFKPYRKEKAKIPQSGGRPIPHVPHNIPDGMMGKPEGLSGSQTEEISFKQKINSLAKDVNNITANFSGDGSMKYPALFVSGLLVDQAIKAIIRQSNSVDDTTGCTRSATRGFRIWVYVMPCPI